MEVDSKIGVVVESRELQNYASINKVTNEKHKHILNKHN